ncbi:heptahelical transmembrane protein 1-like [Coffea arabica]|uniref:Heptahelical transmembrane protein 1-like n=1 Tax=Coffea arabica TaxID=13443 RepID=A0A6P6SV89_COFAR|nr:heptahelical transmembrane protein 1-like [Coffea arabica]
MHKKVARRKSKVVMEIANQKKELQLQKQQQANSNLVTVEVSPAITSKIDDDEEKFSCASNKKLKGCTSIEKRRQRYGLLSFHQLPEYMKDNEFIVNYYRADWPLKEAFFSLFRWHNETLNVWTHLLGFVLFLGLTIANSVHFSQVADFITMFTRHFPTSASTNVSHNSEDFSMGPTKLIDLKREPQLQMEMTSPEMATTSWPFFIFLGGSMFCLLSSSICHLFSCHSHRLNLHLLQMDYAGITVMIITSFFPPIYYVFQCSPHWQLVYLIGITVMGICTIITLLTPAFSTGKYRAFRAILFMSMGFFGLIPAIHSVVVNWNDPHRNVILCYEAVMALSYITGTMFYISRIPERWKPGFFDLTGQSHQLFHVFVVMGALAHYGAAKIFLEYRGRVECEK